MKRMIGVILAIAVAAGFAVVAQARPTAGGSPAGDRNQGSADVTFTKWVTSQPADPSTGGGTSMAGVVGGDVIWGWMKGAHVTGEYRQWDTCPIPTPGNVLGDVCFQGTLHLQR